MLLLMTLSYYRQEIARRQNTQSKPTHLGEMARVMGYDRERGTGNREFEQEFVARVRKKWTDMKIHVGFGPIETKRAND